MRKLPVYLLIGFQSILVSCNGLGGGDPLVIDYCSNLGYSKSVCSCAAKKFKANLSKDSYAEYTELLRNTKTTSEEEGPLENADPNADTFDTFLGGVNKMMTWARMHDHLGIFIHDCRA